MSWHFSRALVVDYSLHISSESLRYALSSEMSSVDAFSCSDKTTGISPVSRYGMTFAHLKPLAGPELLTSFLAASPAKHSRPHQGEGGSQKTFGLKCAESYRRPSPPMCLPRTSPPPRLRQRQMTWPRWVTKPKCFPFPRKTWVQITFGTGIGYLHTPTTKANYAASSMQKHQCSRVFVRVFGRPSPQNQEWLMGWPEGWTDTKPLETAKFRLWQQRLYGLSQTLEEAA